MIISHNVKNLEIQTRDKIAEIQKYCKMIDVSQVEFIKNSNNLSKYCKCHFQQRYNLFMS